jgi:hypothetical protein
LALNAALLTIQRISFEKNKISPNGEPGRAEESNDCVEAGKKNPSNN